MAALLFLFLFAATCPAPFPFFLAAAIHESAHILCAFLLGMGLPRIKFDSAWIKLEYRQCSLAWKKIMLCLSGPLAGILCGIVFISFRSFSLFSLSLAAINILPLSCFDGGGILREVCANFMLPDTAWKVTRAVSVITVIALWILSAVVQLTAGSNYTLLFLSTVLVVTVLTDKE